MAECAMWPMIVVVDAPGFNSLSGLIDRPELVNVQAFITQPPVERLAQPIWGLPSLPRRPLHGTCEATCCGFELPEASGTTSPSLATSLVFRIIPRHTEKSFSPLKRLCQTQRSESLHAVDTFSRRKRLHLYASQEVDDSSAYCVAVLNDSRLVFFHKGSGKPRGDS